MEKAVPVGNKPINGPTHRAPARRAEIPAATSRRLGQLALMANQSCRAETQSRLASEINTSPALTAQRALAININTAAADDNIWHPPQLYQRQIHHGEPLPQPPVQAKVIQAVSQFRSSQLAQFKVAQFKYGWSEVGDAGVLIGDAGERYVIKFGGFDERLAVSLDSLGAGFGFTTTNARIVSDQQPAWREIVLPAVIEAGGVWDKEQSMVPKTKALLMDRLPGTPLHKAVEEMNHENPEEPTHQEKLKATTMCFSMGRMLVMDLLTRNTDRFNLAGLMDDLLATAEERDEDHYGWKGNEGNILVDTVTGNTNPIDSLFTPASDEDQYAHNVATLLTDEDKLDQLVIAGMGILADYNWHDQAYAQLAFKQGIAEGTRQLLAL